MTRDLKNIVLNKIKIDFWSLMWFKMASKPDQASLHVVCQAYRLKKCQNTFKISQQMCLTRLGDQQTILDWFQLLSFSRVLNSFHLQT